MAQQNTQHYDDGTFYISASVDVDNSYNLYVKSYVEVEMDNYEDIDGNRVDAYVDEDSQRFYHDYDEEYDFVPAEVQLQSNSPVSPGHEYGLESDGFACYDRGDETCGSFYYIASVYTSVYVPVVPPPPPPPLDPCAVTSNPQAGYSSFVSTMTPGGSGDVAVTFSGTDFSAFTPSVSYGPYSTPESIAASIAALITRNYFQYGLSAKAFGRNVVYSGTTSLGSVSHTITGPSFTTSTSSAVAAETESACNDAPPQLPSAVISMKFTGSKNPQDRLMFNVVGYTCSESLGLSNCPRYWLWNLEGTVVVTDDASNWTTVAQQIVSGTTTYTYKTSDGTRAVFQIHQEQMARSHRPGNRPLAQERFSGLMLLVLQKQAPM